MTQKQFNGNPVKVVDCEWIKTEIESARERIEEEGHVIIDMPCASISSILAQKVQQTFPELRISLHPAPNPDRNCWLEVDAAFTGPK